MTKKKEEKFDFFEEDKIDDGEPKNVKPAEKQPVKKEPKRSGKVVNIVKGSRIIIDFDGNGESVPYNEEKHGKLKIGDSVEI